MTCATPLSVEICRASSVSAYLSTWYIGIVGDCMAMNRMGKSEGFTFLSEGGLGILVGDCRVAAWMAAWTSSAAPSMSRSRSNWMVMLVDPDELWDVIELTPAMVENWLSRGVATADAIVSGSAPGRLAETLIVGKSTLGSSLTGSVE